MSTQQAYFADVATKVVLPMLKARNKPFVLVFWSRDPDGSQHNEGDSLNTVTPGINGPTSMAGIKNADDNLAQLRKALDDLGLTANTNIIVSADHGFSTISKESKTSPSAKASYETRRRISCRWASSRSTSPRRSTCRCSTPTTRMRAVAAGSHPKAGNGVLGKDPTKPDLVVATNGGSDLIYLPNNDKQLAERTVKALLEQDYISGLFVDDKLGKFPGTLADVRDQPGRQGGDAARPRSWSTSARMSAGCDEPTNCSVEVADTVLRQGQGMHGSFSRGDTMNFMAAIGPDFKAGYVDAAPGQQRRCRRHRGQAARPHAEAPWRADRPRHDRSHAEWRDAKGVDRHDQVAAVGERPAHGLELPARRLAALFRRRGLPRPHCRAR